MVAFTSRKPRRSNRRRATVADGARLGRTAARPERPIRPAMTAAEAQTFPRQSMTNAMIVAATLQSRARQGCICVPYLDTYTYGRWRAMSCQVNKGERGIKVTTWRPVGEGKIDPETGEEKPGHLIAHDTTVFCRCQVSEV